jgi:hypothetical protein
MTEVTTVGANGQASGASTGESAKNTGGTFASVPASDELSSKVVGLDCTIAITKTSGRSRTLLTTAPA